MGIIINEPEFFDNTFIVKGDVDPTKKLALDIDTLVTTGTTRTIAIPDQSGTLALLSDVPGAVNEFVDNVFRINDNADATKQVAIEASGITTGTTRTLTIQDSDGTIAYLSDILSNATTQTAYTAQAGTQVTGAFAHDFNLTDIVRFITSGTFTATAASMNLTGLMTVTDTGSGDSVWSKNNGDLRIVMSTGFDFEVDCDQGSSSEFRVNANILNLNSTGATTITATTTSDVTSTGIMTVSSAANSAVALTLSATNASGGVDINAGNAGPVTIDGQTFSIDSTSTSNLSMVSNSASNLVMTLLASNAGAGRGDLALSANGSTYNLNAGTVALATAATTLVEAINEVHDELPPNVLVSILGSTGTINLFGAIGENTIHTVTTGKTCIVTGVMVRVTTAPTTVTTTPQVGVQVSGGTDDIISDTVLTNLGLGAAGQEVFYMSAVGDVMRQADSTEVIQFSLNTQGVGTGTFNVVADLIGYEF